MSRHEPTTGSGRPGAAGARRVDRIALETRVGLAFTGLLAAGTTAGTDDGRVIGLILGGYLPYTVLVTLLERRRGRPAALFAAVADHLVVFLFAVAIPFLGPTALLAYGIATTYHTLRAGSVVGAASAALAGSLAVAAELVTPGTNVGAFTLVMFVGVQATLVRVVALLTRERRELAVRLGRLDRLVAGRSPDHDPRSVIETVADAATEVLGADGARVVLHEVGEAGPVETHRGADPSSTVAEALDDVLAAAGASDDPVVHHLRATRAGSRGDRGRGWVVVVPLRTADSELGAVAAWGYSELPPSSRSVLAALGDHAVAALLRVGADVRQRQALQRLEEVEQIRDEVITTLSHEIRTPLTASTSFLFILDHYWDRLEPDVRRSMVAQARESSDTVSRLVSRIMDFARFEHQTRLMAPLEVDLAETVRYALARRSALVGRHDVHVDVPARCSVLADPESLDRILGNLIENAATYAPAGSRIEIRARIQPRAGLEHELVAVTVSDEGYGIDPEDLPHVFDPLFRGRQPRPEVRGTGTGLTVVRRLVELLGGHVWVESELQVGTTFGFTLSLAGVPEPAAYAGVGSGQPRSQPSREGSSGSGS